MKRFLLIPFFCALALAASVQLAWDYPEYEEGISFRVYVGEESGNYTRHIDVLGTNFTATVDGLKPGKRYFFAATALLDGSESDYSNEVETDLPLVPPSGLRVTVTVTVNVEP